MTKKNDIIILIVVIVLVVAAIGLKRQEMPTPVVEEGAVATSTTATSTVAPIKPVPTTGGYTKKADIEYAKVDGQSLRLDLYIPTAKPNTTTGKYPVVLEIHGGAFYAGDKSGVMLAPYLAKNGFVVAAVNYRLSGTAIFPAAIHDVKGAVRFLRANAEKYNLDPYRFGAVGASAGGSLAALLGTSYGDATLEGVTGGNLTFPSSVLAVVDLFGPVDMVNLASQRVAYGLKASNVELKYLGCQSWTSCENAKAASALTYVSANDPATFILHGAKDDQIPPKQSQDLYNALTKLGVKGKLIMDAKAGHGGVIFNSYNADIASFLKTYLVNNY